MNLVQKQMAREHADSQDNHTQAQTMTMVELDDVPRTKPNLLRINADNQDKKFMCLFWSLFVIFVIIMIIIAKTLPSVFIDIRNTTEQKGTSLELCNNPSQFVQDVLTCSDFYNDAWSLGLLSRKLKALNQFVFYSLVIKPKNMSAIINIDQNVTYTISSIIQENSPNGLIFKRGATQKNETRRFIFKSSEADKYLNGKTVVGYKKFIGFIGDFPSQTLYFNIQFLGPYEQIPIDASFQIQGFKVAQGFTKFTIALRYVFFFLSIIALILYIRQYTSIPLEDRIIEQKLIGGLSIVLIFFNDPFYAITVLKQNMASSFFSTLFIVSFVVFLIFVWIIFTDRIYYEQGQKQTKQITFVKLGYHIVLFILLIILYMLYASQRINNHPIILNDNLASPGYKGLAIATSLWFAIIIVYYVIQSIRICMKQQKRLYRNQLFLLYSIFFQVAICVFIFTDNSLGAYNYNGTTIMFMYGGLNLYVWYLQYMYSPYKQIDPKTGEMRNMKLDEVITVGAVEFKDANINLDENNDIYYQANKKLDRQHGYQYYQPQKNVVLTKGASNQIKRGEQNQKFSIQDEQQGQAPQRKLQTYQRNLDIQQNKFSSQPNKVSFAQKPAAVNFFDSGQVQKFSKNNPDLQQQKKKQQQKVEQFQLVQSEFDTQTVRSQAPEVIEDKKQQNKFGSFTLE